MKAWTEQPQLKSSENEKGRLARKTNLATRETDVQGLCNEALANNWASTWTK